MYLAYLAPHLNGRDIQSGSPDGIEQLTDHITTQNEPGDVAEDSDAMIHSLEEAGMTVGGDEQDDEAVLLCQPGLNM